MNALAENADLVGIRLGEVTFEVIPGDFEGDWATDLEMDGKTQGDAGHIVYRLTLTGDAKLGGETAYRFIISFDAAFTWDEDIEIGDNDVHEFLPSVVLMVHPYFRELHSSLTSRAGYPDQLLPLMRYPEVETTAVEDE